MAYVEMAVVVQSGSNLEGQFGYEYEDTGAAAGNGPWIIIPVDVRTVTVTCQAAGTTAKVQTTTDKIAVVKAGTAETGVDWDDGAVSTATSAACTPPTAIRLVQAGAGTSKLTVRAQ
jgi:hypothetical protein